MNDDNSQPENTNKSEENEKELSENKDTNKNQNSSIDIIPLSIGSFRSQRYNFAFYCKMQNQKC